MRWFTKNKKNAKNMARTMAGFKKYSIFDMENAYQAGWHNGIDEYASTEDGLPKQDDKYPDFRIWIKKYTSK